MSNKSQKQRQSARHKQVNSLRKQTLNQSAAPVQAFSDNRPETAVQDAQIKMMQKTKVQNNNTGLSDDLKSGIENLSGYSMDDVKVHYNSDKPAQLQAHAYAQGSDIHLGSGQEKYLPHEAWHVVQQKQGRVKTTMQMKGKVNLNNDEKLEKEADVMGNKALSLTSTQSTFPTTEVNFENTTDTMQRKEVGHLRASKKSHLNFKHTKVAQLERAENKYHKSTYKSTDGRTTNLNTHNNTAHHIVPHSTLKKVYESIADPAIDTKLREKVVARFIPGTNLSAIKAEADQYIKAVDALADPIPVIGQATFSGAVVNANQLSGTINAGSTNKEAFKGVHPKTFTLTPLIPGVNRTEVVNPSINFSNNLNFTIPVVAVNGTQYDGQIDTTKQVPKKDALEGNKYFTNPIIATVNSYLEWAKGNQFYGPNANDRFETDKEGVDTIGEYHVELGRYKDQDGIDYVQEHAGNLKLLNGNDVDKNNYADRLKVTISNKIRQLRLEKSKATDPVKAGILYTKITKRYDRLKRLYEINPATDNTNIHVGNDAPFSHYISTRGANNKDYSVKTERLVEQSKIGKMVSNIDNQYAAEHWIKINTPAEAAAVKQLHAGGVHVAATAKENKYIHYSEILNPVIPIWVDDGPTNIVAITAAYANLRTRALAARKLKVKGQKQLNDLVNDDLPSLSVEQIKSIDTATISQNPLNILFTQKLDVLTLQQKQQAELTLLNGANLSKVLELKKNYYFNAKQVSKLTIPNIDSMNNTAINWLVYYHSKDLSIAVKKHIKSEHGKNNILFQPWYSMQKNWNTRKNGYGDWKYL